MTRSVLAALILLQAAACADRPPAPSSECAAAWAEPDAVAFVEELEAATLSDRAVWPGYDLTDPTTVLWAGDTDGGEVCLGVWRAGRALAYGTLPASPDISTMLYGYHLPAANRTGSADGGPRGIQPDTIRSWLEALGVERATIMPITVEDFPFEIPALMKAQIAIHEGFHLEVQSPHWVGDVEHWPTWARQPNRSAVGACYTGTDSVPGTLAEEREALARTLEGLFDDDRAGACEAGRAFLDRRAERYGYLADVTVTRHDSTPGTCAEAEAIMELEEGAADYASWSLLYQLGRADRDQLMRRFRAQQDDVFYLTGAMQLHAVELMDAEGVVAAADRIATSESLETGSITATFEAALQAYCER